MGCSEALHNYYMIFTTVIAALTAGVNLFVIFWMSGHNPFVEMIIKMIIGSESKLIALDYGLGLAAIGIITFFGVSLSSSIFEKYQKPKSKTGTTLFDNLISGVVIGKGIMRKGLAASLVMTYIVLIGLSFSAGTLDNPLGAEDKNGDPPTDVILPGSLNSKDVITNIVIKDIVKFDTIKVTEMNPDSKVIEELILEKEPDSLVEHFTIVISVVIGFYFGSNTLAALLKSRKESQTLDDPLKILKARLATKDISLEEFDKLKARIAT